MRYEKSIEIDAPPEAVWRTITEVERWPNWTESIKRVEPVRGPLGPGAVYKLDVRGTQRADWTVTEFVEGKRFSWHSKIQGVTADAVHEIAPSGAGSKLYLSVDYSGALATVFRPMIGRTTRQNLEMESQGMKRAAEASIQAATA